VTEDAHTSLRMQMRGWNTAYINIPQAAGLATERLSGHIQQRVRWARGMIQILRTDNPLFAKGLKLPQRICYFNAMTHFLYAVPRLVFLTAPLVYLFFSRSNVPGYWAAILAYALPHLVLSNVTNSRIQGQHRHSFWNEIYETVLAPYILLPTLIALINPKLGTFNVTAKGGFVEETYFDGKIATPFVVLLLLNFAGLLMAVPRLVHVPMMEYFWDGTHPGTVYMNGLWCLFNIVILGVATTVAREEIQRREQVRIDFVMPARVKLADGTVLQGSSIDISIGGIALTMPAERSFVAGEWVTLLLPLRVGDAELPCTVIGREGTMLRLQFEELSLLEQEMLTTILYSRADAWLGWGETREPDRPLRSFYRILKLSVKGLSATFAMLFAGSKKPESAVKARVPLVNRVAPLLVLCAALGLVSRPMRAQAAAPGSSAFETSVSLKDLGLLEPIELHGTDSIQSLSFALPLNELTDHATLHLVYRFSARAAASGRFKLLLNGTVFATVQASAGGSGVLDQSIAVPAELLVRDNRLTVEFLSRGDGRCNNATADASWGRIDPSSSFEFSGQRLPLAVDLKQMPLPMLDSEITRQRVIPMVLENAPSEKAMQAAGVVASYFGMVADYPVPRFPVSLGALPQGNIVVVTESSSELLSELSVGAINGPTVALRPNPNDAFGTVLIVTGMDGDQVLEAAQALALQTGGLQGTSATIGDFTLPDARSADDAPHWARSEQKVPLWNAADEERSSDGASPLQLFLRVPPDLYYANRTHLNLHLEYRYQAPATGPRSSLLVRVNGVQAGDILLHHGKEAGSATQADLPLPVTSLRPFSNSLSAQWLQQQRDSTHCAVAAPVSFQGSILQTSYLDLRGLPHWAALPNLELFSNAGFPFTRFADLSQTTVVLPDQPTAQEIEVFLMLLAHFSAQTGYPATRVTLGTAAEMQPGAETDFLVIGTAQDNPGMALAAAQMPVSMDGQQLTLNASTGVVAQAAQLWQKVLASFGKGQPSFETQANPTAILEGLESPYAPGRTLVMLDLQSAAAADVFLSSFLEASHSSAISGDVAMLKDGKFESVCVHCSTYSIGRRPWLTHLTVTVIHDPWLLVVGLILFAVFYGRRMQVVMERSSVTRLHLMESAE
jgi:cellulose synthase (UDP-forming)